MEKIKCPVCNNEAKMVRKNQFFDAPNDAYLVMKVPTIVCLNGDCMQESFDAKTFKKIGIALNGKLHYGEPVSIFLYDPI